MADQLDSVEPSETQSRLSAIIHRLEQWPPAAHLAIALIALGLIAALDVVTPKDLSFSVLYFVPVVWAIWFSGRRASLAVAVLASLAWGFAELAAGVTAGSPSIAMWNEAMRLGLFMLAWGALSELRDISEARRLLALTDPLTGAANLRVISAQIEHEIEVLRRYGTPFTLAYLDLDEFKAVNDSLGHQAGDEVLRSVAHFLVADARKVDTVARLGGDEFALLMPQTDEREASIALQRVTHGLNDVIRDAAPSVHGAGASIGAVVFTHAPWSVDHALSLADQLMYEGKRSGAGSVTLGTHDADPEHR
jgi:diguanylate cyclase (GGDEF)-like protein